MKKQILFIIFEIFLFGEIKIAISQENTEDETGTEPDKHTSIELKEYAQIIKAEGLAPIDTNKDDFNIYALVNKNQILSKRKFVIKGHWEGKKSNSSRNLQEQEYEWTCRQSDYDISASENYIQRIADFNCRDSLDYQNDGKDLFLNYENFKVDSDIKEESVSRSTSFGDNLEIARNCNTTSNCNVYFFNVTGKCSSGMESILTFEGDNENNDGTSYEGSDSDTGDGLITILDGSINCDEDIKFENCNATISDGNLKVTCTHNFTREESKEILVKNFAFKDSSNTKVIYGQVNNEHIRCNTGAPPAKPEKSNGLSAGGIVAIVLVCVAVVATIAVVTFLVKKKDVPKELPTHSIDEGNPESTNNKVIN